MSKNSLWSNFFDLSVKTAYNKNCGATFGFKLVTVKQQNVETFFRGTFFAMYEDKCPSRNIKGNSPLLL